MYSSTAEVVTTNTVMAHHTVGPCGSNMRCCGIVLALLAAASLALGVADVSYTYQTYIVNWGCNMAQNQGWMMCNSNVMIWTWIASGIWASAPIFLYGLMLIGCGAMQCKMECSNLLSYLCTFLFAPAMIILSSLEAFKGTNVYYWTSMSPMTSDDLTKAALPIAIAVLGFLEFLKCLIILCHHRAGGNDSVWCGGCCDMAAMTGPTVVQGQMTGPVSMETKTYVETQPAPITSIYSHTPAITPAPSTPCAPCQQRSSGFATSYYSGPANLGVGNCYSCMARPGGAPMYGYQSNVGNPAYNYFR